MSDTAQISDRFDGLDPAKQQAVLHVLGILEDEPQQVPALDRFLGALARASAAVPSTDLPGLPDVTKTDLDAALARNEARLWEARNDVYSSGLDRAAVAQMLGVGTNQITNLVSSGDLLALDGPDGLRLPKWQFDPDTRRGRLDGIRLVATVFPGGVLGLTSWMLSTNPALGGDTPRQALIEGRVDDAVDAARSFGE